MSNGLRNAVRRHPTKEFGTIMLYFSATTKHGKHVFLGVSKENIDRIRADDPLMARMQFIGGAGLFFIYTSETKRMSPMMIGCAKALAGGPIPYYLFGASRAQLEALEESRGCIQVEPGSKLPGIAKITVMFCEDQEGLIRKMRDEGLIPDNVPIMHVPRSVEEN